MVNLRSYRSDKALKGADVAATLRTAGFIKCDKQVVSKVENPAYGVTFVPGAWGALLKKYGEPHEAPKAAKKEKRARGIRLFFRVTEKEYTAVLQAKEAAGVDTMQDYILFKLGVLPSQLEGTENV